MVYQLKTFCGCQNVEEGSKTVAILQMVAGVVYAAISIYNDMIQGIVGGLVVLLLGLCLFFAVRWANVPLLICWIFANILAIIFLCFEFVVFLSATAGSTSTNTGWEPDGYFIANIVTLIILSTILCFHIYSIPVVFSFVRELQGHGLPIFPR